MRAIVREMTPMIIMDPVKLVAQHRSLICEGDIDMIMPVIMNAMALSNYGDDYDFFRRPEQAHMLVGILNCTDICEEDKSRLIRNAYHILRTDADTFAIPHKMKLYGLKQIIRDNSTSVQDVVGMIEEYWGL